MLNILPSSHIFYGSGFDKHFQENVDKADGLNGNCKNGNLGTGLFVSNVFVSVFFPEIPTIYSKCP